MKVHKLNSFYFTKQFENHNFHKNIILGLIKKIPKNTHDNITHTDWSLPEDYNREYLDYFYLHIKSYMRELNNFLNTKKWKIYNGWFQQYYQNDTHPWHTHDSTNFTNVYYLELPNKKYKTEIFDNLTNKLIDVDVKEGDILTFPAFYSHRSNIILSNERKTVISFNSNFYDCDQEKINSALTKSIK